jgi:hypothetical protein
MHLAVLDGEVDAPQDGLALNRDVEVLDAEEWLDPVGA